MHILLKTAEQLIVDSQGNATATATLAAPGTGFKWRVTGWRASYSGVSITVGLEAILFGLKGVTITRGVTSSDAWEVDLTSPIDGPNNGAIFIQLPPGGVGSGVHVSIQAYRVPITLTDG